MPGLANLDPAAFGALGLSKDGLEQAPLGVAIWPHLSAEAEAKIDRGQKLELGDWKSGDRLWLLELISPFANEQNKLTHAMMFDLMSGPFKTSPFRLHRTDPKSGKRQKILVEEHLKLQVGSGEPD